MKKFGISLISLGIYCVLFAFNMDVVIGTTYNIGLLNERQNIIYLSGVIFLAGIILFGFSLSSQSNNNENINKRFIFYCSLPILLFFIFKISSPSIDTYIKQQKAIETKLEAEFKVRQEIEKKNLELERVKLKLETDFNKNFFDNNDGTVTHKKTKLIFQRCSLGQEWKYSACMSVLPAPVNATLASIKFNQLAVELLKSGWRIPTKEELSLIIYCSDGLIDIKGNCSSRQTSFSEIDTPTINKLIFPNSPSGYYLTSSLLENNDVWHVNFERGYVISRDKDSTSYIRLVRNGS